MQLPAEPSQQALPGGGSFVNVEQFEFVRGGRVVVGQQLEFIRRRRILVRRRIVVQLQFVA